ncbi:MAG: hypothetical protein WCP93_00970 [Candidatus Berkelbacteria bacterium]
MNYLKKLNIKILYYFISILFLSSVFTPISNIRAQVPSAEGICWSWSGMPNNSPQVSINNSDGTPVCGTNWKNATSKPTVTSPSSGSTTTTKPSTTTTTKSTSPANNSGAVQNVKASPSINNNVCKVVLSWKKPAKTNTSFAPASPADNVKYDVSVFAFSGAVSLSPPNNIQVVDYNTTSLTFNNIKCGLTYKYYIVTKSRNPNTTVFQIEDGRASGQFAAPIGTAATAFPPDGAIIDSRQNETTKTYTGTLQWREPINKPAGKTGNDLKYRYTLTKKGVASSPVTVNKPQSGIPVFTNIKCTNEDSSGCGQYKALIETMLDGQPIGSHTSVVTIAKDGQAVSQADSNGQTLLDIDNYGSADQNGNAGENAACGNVCESNVWGWFNPVQEIKHVICQIQCTILDFIAGALGQAFTTILLPNLL